MKIIKIIVMLLLLTGFNATMYSKSSTIVTVPQPGELSTQYLKPVFTDPERLQKITALFPELETVFKRHAEKNHYPGYVYGIVVDGSLVFSGAAGNTNIISKQPVTNNSQFHIASMTKSFTAMAILKLRDEGKLLLSDPVSKYIPELTSVKKLTTDAMPININHLLTMTSGLPEDDAWADRHLEDSDEKLINMIKGGLSFSRVPSEYFEYSNLGYALLGTIVSRVSGTTYQKYITRHILNPLGMTKTYWEYSKIPANELAQGYRWEDGLWKAETMLHTGAFGAIGGLITSLNDFSKYVAFHMSAWPPRNEPDNGPVKRSSIREMHTPGVTKFYANAKDINNEPCPLLLGYSFGMVILQNCKEVTTVGHSGGLPGFGSNYIIYPEYGIGIILFSNRTYAPTSSANKEAGSLLFNKGGIKKRTLPASNILSERFKQVVEIINTWDKELGDEILADNFYLDHSREIRMREAKKIMASLGKVIAIEPLIPINQLRGNFVMHGEQNDIKVFFSLTPERNPKVQTLKLTVIEKANNH